MMLILLPKVSMVFLLKISEFTPAHILFYQPEGEDVTGKMRLSAIRLDSRARRVRVERLPERSETKKSLAIPPLGFTLKEHAKPRGGQEEGQMGAKVLIVEDDASVGTIEQMMVEAGGYEVRWLRDASRLMEEIARDEPDLVIMDVMLPEKSGLDAVKELTAHPGLRNIPVLYVSVLDLPDRFPHALRRGRVGFLQKPFEMKDLIGGIERLLG